MARPEGAPPISPVPQGTVYSRRVQQAALWVLGLAIAAGNLYYWHLVVRRWEDPFRAWVERRYGVVVTRGGRGHWSVSGSGSRLRDLAIELLQLVYFMGAFVAWSVGMLLCVGLMSLVAP
jgi:hypothetical protein